MVFKYYKKINKFLKDYGPTINTTGSFVMLILSIVAIKISIWSFNKSNQQFENNSVKSDSLFNLQLSNEKQLNDSLVKNIKVLHKLTANQIELTNKQLLTSADLLEDQKKSGIPIVNIREMSITDKAKKFDGATCPTITAVIFNAGHRSAYNLKLREFCLSNDFNESHHSFFKQDNPLVSGEPVPFTILPHIISFHFPWYFCLEVTYSDRLTSKKFGDTFFFELNVIRGDTGFANSSSEMNLLLRESLNKELKLNKEDLLWSNKHQ